MPLLLAFLIFGFLRYHLGLVAVVLVLAITVFLAPDIPGQILDKLGNIGRILYNALSEFWGLWCILTFIPWKFVDTFKAIFFSTTLGVVALSALHIIVDSVPVAQALAKEFPQLLPSVLKAKELLVQHAPSLRTDLILLALAIAAFWHTIVEFFHSLRREEVPKFLGNLITQFDKFREESPDPDQGQKDVYLQELMTNATTLLDKNGKRKVVISIMAEETTKDASGNHVKTGYLKVDPVPVGTKLDADLRLRVVAKLGEKKFQGEGAAGRAFYLQAPVYIPKVVYQVGIRLDIVRSLGATYKKSNDEITLRSILSVPVLVTPELPAAAAASPGSGPAVPAVSVRRSVAVITASSSRSHAFTRDDVRILELVAVYIATLY